MADKIGVLGEATTTTGGGTVTTVYTVPSAKAARFKIMYEIQGSGSDSTTDFTITVNGIVVMTHSNITQSNFLHSSPNAMKEGPNAAQPTGVDDDTTMSPAPSEYFMSAGDIMSYTIGGTAAAACNVQAVGVEIDV